MPYIANTERPRARIAPETPGELNYSISAACAQYIRHKGLSYTTINDILGALSGAQLEFYRRLATDYEDKKIALNGDIYL